MGNQSYQQNFNEDQWLLIEKTASHSAWRNRRQPSLNIEEHEKFGNDEYIYKAEKDIFQFRQNSPYLVAGLFFQENQSNELCSTSYKYRVFIEKIPIRLSDVEHIPFPDTLHLYHQCLHGFNLLAQKLDYYFEVEQSYIGINEQGVVKVWLSKYLANHCVIGGKILQEQMVKGIVDILDKNSDHLQNGQKVPTVRNYLYRNSDTLKFAEAKRQLQAYIATYNNGIVPNKLDCVANAGGVYFIANRPEVSSQSSIAQTPYSPEFQPQSSRFQPQTNQNRPQLVSNTNISQSDIISQGSYQKIQYMPLAPLANIPNQVNLKSSQTFPQTLYFSQATANPIPIRQNIQGRRRKSDYEKQLLQFQGHIPANAMKYSQVLQQQFPLQNRLVTFGTNPPTTVRDNIHKHSTFMTSSQFQQPKVVRIDAPRWQSPMRSIGQPHQQITFKHLNQNGQIMPSLSFSGNPSINNFSLGPSLINSHRANTSNAYIQHEANSQKAYAAPISPPSSSNNRYQQISNNSNLLDPQKKLEQGESRTSNHTLTTLYKEKYDANTFEKQREANVDSSVNPPEQQLLASFNPYFTNPKSSQSPFSKLQLHDGRKLQALGETSHSQKKSVQINANDGKSSEQFLRQMRQMNQSFTNNQRPKSSYPLQTTPVDYYSNLPSYKKDLSKDIYQETNVKSFEQIGAPTPAQSMIQVNDEQFGRNAVSNIIDNQESSYKNFYNFANTEPLKFQKGISMKYSILEPDQPQKTQHKKSAYAQYQTQIDSELMADLNRLKQ